MNMPPTFFSDATFARLPSGDTPAVAAVDGRFFAEAFQERNFLPDNAPELPEGGRSRDIATRVPATLRDFDNRATFVLLEADVNNVKQSVGDVAFICSVVDEKPENIRISWREFSREVQENMLTLRQIWQLHNFFDPVKFKRRFDSGRATLQDAIVTYRTAKATFNYLNTPAIHRNMITVLNNLRSEFRLYQNHWNANNPTIPIDLFVYWDVWIRDLLRQVATAALVSAERGYAALLDMAPAAGEAFADGLILVGEWVEELQNVQIDTTGLE
jgi:hypothetical protein